MPAIEKALDYALLIKIWEEAVRATHTFLTEAEIGYYKSRMPEYFAHVDLYQYRNGDGIGGFAGIAGNKLEMLFVKDRGKGIGKKLLEYAVKEMGVREVDVNEENSSALAFYRSQGFAVAGRSETDGEGKPHPLIQLKLIVENN